MLTGYKIEDPCIGRVYTNSFGKLAIEILVGCIAINGWYVNRKFVVPTDESLVKDGDYIRVIQEVNDTKPGNPWKGVLFVSCQKLQPEKRLDWNKARAFQGSNFLGASTAKLYVKVDEYRCFQDVQIEELGSKDLECKPIRFEVVGNEVHFFVSPKEGLELSGALGLDLGAWPLSWRGIPGWESAHSKWLIAQRSKPQTAIRA